MLVNLCEVSLAIGAQHRLPVNGEALHKDIPPDHWCVTRNDLKRLRAIVKAAILEGDIMPTDLDDFDTKDDEIGPCIHTVNLQFIKPLTALAGNCSWALMCNPCGGKCDVFVTHAWHEGIFEFIDKVLHSWPLRAKYAYCCMLSNPQNLDIAGMISSPSDSPFAKALWSASYMLVVPNRRISIYTRIWCAYEAFLAYTWGKMIFTASAPVRNLSCSLMGVAACGLLGCIGALLMEMRYKKLDYDEFQKNHPGGTWTHKQHQELTAFATFRTSVQTGSVFLSIVCALLSALSRHSLGTRIVNYLGMLTSCLPMGSYYGNISNYEHTISQRLCSGVFHSMMVAFFVVAEADRKWGTRSGVEANDLIRGYTGQLCDAQSSQEEDKRAILAEIGRSGQHLAVNEAVDVLIQAGMSSPCLQLAASLGVDVKFTSRCKVSVALIAWGHWFFGPLHDLSFATRLTKFEMFAEVALWFQCLLGIGLYYSLSMDRRTFTSLAVLKVFFVLYMFPEAVSILAETYTFFGLRQGEFVRAPYSGFPPAQYAAVIAFGEHMQHFTLTLDAFVIGPSTLLLTCMGPGRLARVPVVGKMLSQYILGNSFKASAMACFSWLCSCCNWRQQEGLEAPPIDMELGRRLST